ncbi:MAG: hypothetical protein JST76_01750 [Bacteroidetes bacterium]|nr:hypothetical protein [Bacteroidota bacterium]
MTDRRYKVWFYIGQELELLLPVLAELCESSDMKYDCENIWEWIEGHSHLYASDVNICRNHGGMRLYGVSEPEIPYDERPIMIMFMPHILPLDIYKHLAQRISQKLKVIAYYGTLTIQSDDTFISDASGSFGP